MSEPSNGHRSLPSMVQNSPDPVIAQIQDGGMLVQIKRRNKQLVIQYSRNGILRGFEVLYTTAAAQGFSAAILRACSIIEGEESHGHSRS